MELTKEEAIALHHKLWDWLAKNPKKEKYEWPEWERFERLNPQLHEYCFACMVTSDSCEKCVLMWPGRTCSYLTEDEWSANGLFEQWAGCGNMEERANLAAQIRDLPVREEVPNAPTT